MRKGKILLCVSACLILAIALLTLLPAYQAKACGSPDDCAQMNQWFLTDNKLTDQVKDGSVWVDMYQMVQGNDNTPQGTICIPFNGSVIWIADQPTAIDAPFPVEGNQHWQVKLTFSTEACASGFDVYLGYILKNASNQYIFYQTAAGVLDHSQNTKGQNPRWHYYFNISDPDFMVPAGGWLAFKIANPRCCEQLCLRTGCTEGWLKAPDCPTYPVPEVPTVALFATGLLGIVGWVVVKRRMIRATR